MIQLYSPFLLYATLYANHSVTKCRCKLTCTMNVNVNVVFKRVFHIFAMSYSASREKSKFTTNKNQKASQLNIFPVNLQSETNERNYRLKYFEILLLRENVGLLHRRYSKIPVLQRSSPCCKPAIAFEHRASNKWK